MSINKKIEIEWKGEKYSVLATMRFIDELDEQLNIAMMIARCSRGDLRFSHLAKLIAFCLQQAGCEADQEAVYESCYTEDPTPLFEMANLILSACTPTMPDEDVDKKK